MYVLQAGMCHPHALAVLSPKTESENYTFANVQTYNYIMSAFCSIIGTIALAL